MTEAASKAGREIQNSSRSENETSIAAMKRLKLQEQDMTPEMEAEWRSYFEAVYPKVRGKLVPEDILDQVQKDLGAVQRHQEVSGESMSAAADLLSTAAWETQSFPDQGKRNSLWSVGENIAIAAVLMSMMLLPLLDPSLRWIFGSAAQSTGSIVQHLVLVVGMLGGAIAAAGTTPSRAVQYRGKPVEWAPQKNGFKRARPPSRSQRRVTSALAAWQFVRTERDTGHQLAYGIPVWAVGASPPLRIRGHHAANLSTFGEGLDAPDFVRRNPPCSWCC